MKKATVLVVVAVGLASGAEAQESYTVNATAAHVTRLDRQRTRWNTAVCARFALAPSCTQALACSSAGVGSCVTANIRAADIEIFPNTLTGRNDYFVQKILKALADAWKSDDVAKDAALQCVNWTAANQTTRDGMCTAASLPAGCDLCP